MYKISALMSVYNVEKYILETLNSILNQTFKDFELIIVDDGSTDKTVELIQKVPDKRIKLYRLDKNYGVGYALKFGVSKCDSKYVVKVDADDLYQPDKFKKQLFFLEENTNIDILGTIVSYFADDEQVLNSQRFKSIKRNEPTHNSFITHEDISKVIYTCKPMQHPTYMIKTELLKKFNYRPIRFGEDYDLFFRLFINGYVFHKYNEALTRIRISNNSTNARMPLDESSIQKSYEDKIVARFEHCKRFFENKRIYIWGAGRNGYINYDILLKYNVDVVGFIDSNKYGQKDNRINKIILSPDEFLSLRPKVYISTTSGMIDIIKFFIANNFLPLYDYI